MFEDIRQHYFPARLTPAITARAVDLETIRPVWDALSARIFSPLSDLGHYRQPAERHAQSRPLQAVYDQRHSERIVFYTADDQPIGWSSGAMLDAHTFFMTWSGLLPAYQNQGLYTHFLAHFIPYLRALGYERVASKHMVNNRQVLVAKLRAGFHITGVELDERWGAQVSLVYYLHEDRRQGFSKAFSLEPYTPPPAYQSAPRSLRLT